MRSRARGARVADQRWYLALELRERLLRTTLENGLKVVLIEDHSAPVVALNVWVRTGSADERPDEYGMAHVFEHMLFKGTQRRAVGEIAATVEAAGGNINAFTSYDMTVYHITMASRDAGVGIDVLADAVQHSTFDPDELARELDVVVKEIERGLDSPDTVLSQAIFDLAYTRHPYRRPVIGSEASVRAMTREQMLAFLRRWYVPNNMTFVVAGDFDPQETLHQIRDAFRNARPSPALAHGREPEPRQSTRRARVLRTPFEQTQLGIAYPISRFTDTDTAYLYLLSVVLGGGDVSRLCLNVKERAQLVHQIGASPYTPLDPGLFFIDARLDAENVERALAAMAEEVERIRRFGPSAVELERARTNLLADSVREKETMDGQAQKHGYYEALADGIELEEAYLAQIRSATVEDLQRVAIAYLEPARANLVLLLPEAARPELDEHALLAAYATPPHARSVGVTNLGNGVVRAELPNGLRVVVKRTTTVPLVSMRLGFLGGQLAETPDTQGIASFTAEMLERGTEQRSAAELASEVESIAGSLHGFSGRNTFGVTAEFLSRSLDSGIELFSDVLLRPRFAPEEIEKVRRETLAAIERREDNLAQQAFDLFAEALYTDHPYRFRTDGTRDTVRAIDSAALRRYYDKYAQPGNAVLSVVGDIEPDKLIEALEIYLRDWQGHPAKLPPRPRLQAPNVRREVAITKNRKQVHLVVGFPGLALDDPDGPALDVLTQILSGQGGRLFLELRDRQSLAYTVTAFSIAGVDPGSFGVYIATESAMLDTALRGIEKELRKILEQSIAPQEVDRARAYVIGSQAVSLQRFSNQATALSLDELYGLGATYHLEYDKRVSAVQVDDVQRIAQRVLQLDTPIVAIVK
jgi:zinc protease